MKKYIWHEIGRIFLKMLPLGRTANDVLLLVSKVNSSQRDLDKQVEEAMEALTKSTELVSSLEKSLDERAKKLDKLKSEYDRVSKLAEITKEQGDAVAKTLEQALGKTQNRERLIAFVISLIAGLIIFVFGVFVSDWVQNLPALLGFGGETAEPAHIISDS